MLVRFRDPRLVARPLICGAALVALSGTIAASMHRTPVPLSMATEGPPTEVHQDPPADDFSLDIGPTIPSPGNDPSLELPASPGDGARSVAPSHTGDSTTTTASTGSPTPPPTDPTEPVDEEHLGALVGTVVDNRGEGIPDICIVSVDRVTGRLETNGRTDADGRYRAEGVRADVVTLQMCHPERTPFGWMTATLGPGFDLSDGKDHHGEMQLTELGALRGRAVDASGNPLAGRCVTLADIDVPQLVGDNRVFGTAVTDQDGRFTVPNLMPSWLPLTVDVCGPGGGRLIGPASIHILSGQWTDAVVTPSSPNMWDNGDNGGHSGS